MSGVKIRAVFLAELHKNQFIMRLTGYFNLEINVLQVYTFLQLS